jgi:hypothetical protein
MHTRSSSNARSSSTCFSFASGSTGMDFKPRTRSTTTVFQNDENLCKSVFFLPSKCLLLSRIFWELQSLVRRQNTSLTQATYLDKIDHVFRCIHNKAASYNIRQLPEIAMVRTISLWRCSERGNANLNSGNCWLQFLINGKRVS